MTKFEIGMSYNRSGLFGPSFTVTCVARTENTATFAQAGYEAEVEDWAIIEIENDIDGCEMCQCWEYMGHKGWIRADS